MKPIFTKLLIASLGFVSPLSLANNGTETFDSGHPEKDFGIHKALNAFHNVWEIKFIENNKIHLGSGFFISPNHFVTALHVVRDAIQEEIVNKIVITKKQIHTISKDKVRNETSQREHLRLKSKEHFRLRAKSRNDDEYFRLRAKKHLELRNQFDQEKSRETKTISKATMVKEVIALSVEKDLVLLETEDSVSSYLPVREQVSDISSEQLAILGYPQEKARIIKNVSQINNLYDDLLYFNIDRMHFLDGMSGGAVIDSQGQAVAVLYGSTDEQTIKTSVLGAFIHELERFSCEGQTAKDCFKESMDLLYQRAEEGNVSAQYRLSFLYRIGLFLKEDEEQDKRWLSLAAQQGHPIAQYDLGDILYRKGKRKTAISLITESAKAGYSPAQYTLGDIMYMKGYTKKAVHWFQKAVEAGHIKAQYKLGWIKKKQNEIESKKWFSLAAQQGHPMSQYELAEILKKEGNIKEAKPLFKKVAELGYSPAQFELALILIEEGQIKEAKSLLLEIVRDDHTPPAQDTLAMMLEAVKPLFRKEIYASALHQLALILKREGKIEEAIHYLKMAKKEWHFASRYELIKIEFQNIFNSQKNDECKRAFEDKKLS